MTISLIDGFSRPITYLRVSVTDKCNLRCIYCMPEGGLPWLQRAEILSYEEIAQIVRAGASIGVRTIRLTGGEPLVRRNLSRLVAAIAAVPGSTTSPFRPTRCSWRRSFDDSLQPGCVASTSRSILCEWTVLK